METCIRVRRRATRPARSRATGAVPRQAEVSATAWPAEHHCRRDRTPSGRSAGRRRPVGSVHRDPCPAGLRCAVDRGALPGPAQGVWLPRLDTPPRAGCRHQLAANAYVLAVPACDVQFAPVVLCRDSKKEEAQQRMPRMETPFQSAARQLRALGQPVPIAWGV